MQDHLTTAEEAPSRVAIEWSPGLIQAAKRQAEQGNLRLAAELCSDLLADDARVRGTLRQRVLGLLGLPLSFSEQGDRRQKSRITKALEDDFWEAFPEPELARLVSWGLLLGVGLGQLRWEQVGPRLVPRLRAWHPRALRWDWNARRWYVLCADGRELVLRPGDGSWVLFAPYGDSSPWQEGAWRSCALWSLLKSYALRDWGRESEVAGGIRTAEIPSDVKSASATPKDRQELARDLSRIGKNGAVVPMPGWKLGLVQSHPNTYETFKEQVVMANQEIAIAVCGQNLTSGVDEKGSHALGSVHKAVLQSFIEFDAEALATCLHRQVLGWWAEYNFGSREMAPWAGWETAPPEDLLERAQTLDKLADATAKLKSQGLSLDYEAIAQDYSIPLLKGAPLPEPEAPKEEAPSPAQSAAPRAQADASQAASAQSEKQEAEAAAPLSAKPSRGVMVALYPAPEVAAGLVVPGGEAAEHLHLTLVYLGNVGALAPGVVESLEAVCASVAGRFGPLSGQLSGLGRFSGGESSEHKDALWASPDIPGLSALRESLVGELRAAGVPLPSEHGFQPHITLAYLDTEAPSPLVRLAPRPVGFGALSLIVAGTRRDFSLYGINS
jgi:phage gp29-like protein/2'-5' RNA ligase